MRAYSSNVIREPTLIDPILHTSSHHSRWPGCVSIALDAAAIDGVDQEAEAAEVAAVEAEDEPRELSDVGLVAFQGQGRCLVKAAVGHKIDEFAVDRFEQRGMQRLLQAEHEVLLDVAHAVIDAKELQDFVARGL